MILWHLGFAAALTYVTLGRRRIDYRFVLLGSVLPDAVDPVLGATVFEAGGDRFAAHSLAAVVLVAVAIVVSLSGERRLAVFGVAVGWLTHLVGDGMWEAPLTFLWPAFGFRAFTVSSEPYGGDLLADPSEHLSTWAAEGVGAAILAWFWSAFRLGEAGRLRSFARDGRLRP